MEPDPTTDRAIDLRRYYTDRAVTALLIAAMNARGRAHGEQGQLDARRALMLMSALRSCSRPMVSTPD